MPTRKARDFAEEFASASVRPVAGSAITLTRNLSVDGAVIRLLRQLAGGGPVHITDSIQVERPGRVQMAIDELRSVAFSPPLNASGATPLGQVSAGVVAIRLADNGDSIEVLVFTAGIIKPDVRIVLRENTTPDPTPGPDTAGIADSVRMAVAQSGVTGRYAEDIETYLLRAHSSGILEHHQAMTAAAGATPTADTSTAKRMAAEMRSVGIIPGGILLWLTIGRYVIEAIVFLLRMRRKNADRTPA